ncbi:kinase-like domain-containing protein [Crassisporium funariophilum]|nr:kinase-like domain-containing protein [Crassisporium funariophilum]
MNGHSSNTHLLTPDEVECLQNNDFNIPCHRALMSANVKGEVVRYSDVGGRVVRLCTVQVAGTSGAERRRSIRRILSKLKTWRSRPSLNTINLFGVYTSPDEPYLSLMSNCLNAVPVLEYLQRNDGDRLKFCIDIAYGLDHLHNNNIIHSAIRAENVLVQSNGACCLGEFSPEDTPSEETLIRYSYWIAPELVDIKRLDTLLVDRYRRHEYNGEYRMPSDVFALGCTFIEIYTNEPPEPIRIPYDVVTSAEALVRRKREPTEVERKNIPKDVWGVVEILLSYSPNSRPDSCLLLQWLLNPGKLRVIGCQPTRAKNIARRLARE